MRSDISQQLILIEEKSFLEPALSIQTTERSNQMNLRNNRRKTLWLVFLTMSISLINPGLAESTQLSSNDNKVMSTLGSLTASHSQELTRDGLEFLKSMSEAADALETYQFESHMNVFKGGKTIDENSKFFFKKPRKMRAEELGPFKKGSVAVLLPNGKVKGHMGGLMSKFVGVVDADSEWVSSANGYPLNDSDFYGMCKVMLDFVKSGKKTLVTEQPVTVNGQAKPVYVLEMYKNPNKEELMKRAYINPQTLLPVEWFDYKNGKLFAHTLWRDLKTNVEIADSLFDI